MKSGKARTISDVARISQELSGEVVSDVSHPDPGSLAIHFASGSTLAVQRQNDGVKAVLSRPKAEGSGSGSQDRPTRRQKEYLDFIKKYMSRYGVAPAETDIQRHFMVSAPSVNSMVRTLERRGFISRDRDWFGQTIPRSIRVVWEG